MLAEVVPLTNTMLFQALGLLLALLVGQLLLLVGLVRVLLWQQKRIQQEQDARDLATDGRPRSPWTGRLITEPPCRPGHTHEWGQEERDGFYRVSKCTHCLCERLYDVDLPRHWGFTYRDGLATFTTQDFDG